MSAPYYVIGDLIDSLSDAGIDKPENFILDRLGLPLSAQVEIDCDLAQTVIEFLGEGTAPDQAWKDAVDHIELYNQI